MEHEQTVTNPHKPNQPTVDPNRLRPKCYELFFVGNNPKFYSNNANYNSKLNAQGIYLHKHYTNGGLWKYCTRCMPLMAPHSVLVFFCDLEFVTNQIAWPAHRQVSPISFLFRTISFRSRKNTMFSHWLSNDEGHSILMTSLIWNFGYSYIWTADKDRIMCRSSQWRCFNLSGWKEETLKNSGLSGNRTHDLCDTSAAL